MYTASPDLIQNGVCCREIDGYNPYVQFENGTFIAAQAAKFCNQDAQATQTGKMSRLQLHATPIICTLSLMCYSMFYDQPCMLSYTLNCKEGVVDLIGQTR